MSDHPDPNPLESSLLEKFSAAATARSSPGGLSVPERRCFIHREIEGLYYCPNCRVWRCKDCAHTFEGVGVCPDCDSLSLDASKVQQLGQRAEEAKRPFRSHLARALSYPLRHPVFTVVTCLVVWLTGGIVQVLSEAAEAVPLSDVLTGPMVRWSGTVVAFSVAGAVAMTRLLARANGHESWKGQRVEDFSILGEPVAYWMASAFIGLAPLGAYLWFPKFKMLMMALIVGVDYTAEVAAQTSPIRIAILCLLSLWAAFFYPMAFVVAAIRKSVSAILNPMAAVSAWLALNRWLIPAFALSLVLITPAALAAYFLREKPYGLAVYSLLTVLANLVSAQAIGAAVAEGLEKGDVEGTIRIKLPDLSRRPKV